MDIQDMRRNAAMEKTVNTVVVLFANILANSTTNGFTVFSGSTQADLNVREREQADKSEPSL